MDSLVDSLDGTALGLVCACGLKKFERIVVDRKPKPPFVTEFVACARCRAMYHSPVRVEAPSTSPESSPQPTLRGTAAQGGTRALPSPSTRIKPNAVGRLTTTAQERARFDALVKAADKSKRKR